jgi:transposase
MRDKTDANDAEGLAHLVRAGWYREVRVKGRSAMLAKALLGARSQLLSMSVALENQIRGILKTFGRIGQARRSYRAPPGVLEEVARSLRRSLHPP